MQRDPKDTPEASAPTLASGDAPTVAEIAGPDAAPGTWPSRYRVGKVIGRGGMGEVLSARDEQIGRSVAIKRMRGADQPEATERFLREAKIQGRLDHPAIVPVHELSHDDLGQPFFVMKQLAGVTLGDVLAGSDPAYTRQRLLRAFAEVCLAIEFAHTRGIVHRDLKPANIVLGDFGEVYVLDWGIAHVAGDDTGRASFADVTTLDHQLTLAGALLGTPGYMSPEQIRADAELDARSDVYALGCILFEILTRTPLHPRGHAALALALAGADARASVRAPELDLAPELDAICVTATALDRDARYATARALGDAVQRYLDGDRDLALRRELARTELAAARDALARGGGDDERRIAIRAAARALALDPHAREPAELVGRLMIEPPAHVPAEVEHELAKLEGEALTVQAGLATRVIALYFAVFPILYWSGMRRAWYLVGGPAIVLATGTWYWLVGRRPRPWNVAVMLLLNMLILAMFSRMLSPFLVAPALAVVTGMAFAMHPWTGRPWVLWLSVIVAVLGPWIAELLGLLSATTSVVGNHLVLVADAADLDPFATKLTLTGYVLAVTAIGVVFSRSIVLNRRAIQLVVQTQAWQLKQLVPRAPTAPPV